MHTIVYSDGVTEIELNVPWEYASSIIPPPLISFFLANSDLSGGDERVFRYVR